MTKYCFSRTPNSAWIISRPIYLTDYNWKTNQNLEPLQFDSKSEFKLNNNKQENIINQNSAIMSEETEVCRDFLTNETIFSEDQTNSNIL